MRKSKTIIQFRRCLRLAIVVNAACTALLLAGENGTTGSLSSGAAEKWRLGLLAYLPFDGDLSYAGAGGEGGSAGFQRAGRAYNAALEPYEEHQPRYLPGRFGRGIFVEPGREGASTPESYNWLPPAMAEITPDALGEAPLFRAVGKATVTILTGGSARADGVIMEGDYALQVANSESSSGVESAELLEIPGGRYALSLHLRTAPSHDSTMDNCGVQIEVYDATNSVLAHKEVQINANWQRVELTFENGKFVRNTKQQVMSGVGFRLVGTRAGQRFLINGAMLEMLGGFSYAGMGQASSWLPGHASRAGESLDVNGIKHLLKDGSGSVAFWVQAQGEHQYRRTFFELASDNRWTPYLSLWTRSGRLGLMVGTNNIWDASARGITADKWHHLAVTWGPGGSSMYLDGDLAGTTPAIPELTELPAIRLGGVGPAAPANAVIDEAVFYNRILTADEIATLAARTTPLSDELALPLVIAPEMFVATIARGTKPQPWRCILHNLTTSSLSNVEVCWQIGDDLLLRHTLLSIPAQSSRDVVFSFVADLECGTYPLLVTAVRSGKTIASFSRTIEITPAPEPFENLQVAPWNVNALREEGMTCGGADIEEAMRRGLHSWPQIRYLGWPRNHSGEDMVYNMNMQPTGRVRLRSPYLQEQIRRQGQRFAGRFANLPAVRGVTINTEMQWHGSHDYSQENIAWVKETFGLDLSRWLNPTDGNVNHHQTPYGRLKPEIGGIALPENRVIPLSEPIYAYHRWFLGPQGPTEASLNQTLGAAIHKRRPDILTIQEPILRRPSIRAFNSMDIAQEWFYYENPIVTVGVQECLNAAVRGTGMRTSGMPQFLFKAGGAAPYNAVPTADLFREAAWLCAMQPIRLMTYWNFKIVPDPRYTDQYSRLYTQEALNEIFGSATPTWDEVKKIMAERPELANMMPWSPDLIAAFKEFHLDTIGPLAGLIPLWENRPRRVALLRSFANELYNGVRWPRFGALENGIVYSGIPFDVLYDQDFEESHQVLQQYDVVVVAGAVCLTEPVFQSLSKFSREGGAVVVDKETKIAIPGAIVIDHSGMSDATAAVAALEEELRQRSLTVDDPAYIEAVSKLVEDGAWPDNTDPELMTLLGRRVKAEARSLTRHTWMNLLTAGGANYIGVVNDLRTSGPMYGHFGKVREQGVPQMATIACAPELGVYAYDLVNSCAVEINSGNGVNHLRLALPAAGGRLVMLTPQPVGEMTLVVTLDKARWGDQRGRELLVRARLQDTSGKEMAGVIPATMELLAPDGTKSDFSRHTVFKEGRLTQAIPVSRNGAPGIWRLRLRERATGQTMEKSINIPAP